MSNSNGGMFDFNKDGHTDSGEKFIGYQIYKDTTGGDHIPTPKISIGPFEMILLGIAILSILSSLAKVLN